MKIETPDGKTEMEICTTLQEICGEEAVNRISVFKKTSHFQEDFLIISGDCKLGKPLTSKDKTSVTVVQLHIEGYPCLSV